MGEATRSSNPLLSFQVGLNLNGIEQRSIEDVMLRSQDNQAIIRRGVREIGQRERQTYSQ